MAAHSAAGLSSRHQSGLSRFDVKDLVLQSLAARSLHLDGLALLPAHDRLADRRLVRELVLGRVRLRGADDVVLDGLLRGHVPQLHLRAHRDDVLLDVLLRDHASIGQLLLEDRDAMLEQRLVVLGVVVLRVFCNVAELARDADALRYLAALVVRQVFDLLLELLVALRSEDHFLHGCSSSIKMRGAQAPSRPSMVPTASPYVKLPGRGYDLASMQVDLQETWRIGPVEIPSRLVL